MENLKVPKVHPVQKDEPKYTYGDTRGKVDISDFIGLPVKIVKTPEFIPHL